MSTYPRKRMVIDIGRLTQDETVDILREAIQVLPESIVLNVLKEVLTMAQIDELVESLP